MTGTVSKEKHNELCTPDTPPGSGAEPHRELVTESGAPMRDRHPIRPVDLEIAALLLEFALELVQEQKAASQEPSEGSTTTVSKKAA